MEANFDTTERDLVDCLTKLNNRRGVIESEMSSISEDLSSAAFLQVGLNNPLIDHDGFPLPGVDLHEVRTKRNRFAILSTDLKRVEDELHELLLKLHEYARSSGTIRRGDKKPLLPFGKISDIVSGSAADLCGLLVGDRIIRFGALQATNPDAVAMCYDSIPTVVQTTLGNCPIEIQVTRMGRENEEIVLFVNLVNGRLGCLIQKL
jgi:hypothetical protein